MTLISNPYKYFRDVNRPNEIQRILYNLPKDRYLSKAYDEPTYLTFKLEFFSPLVDNNTGFETNFDKMPHPLFLDLIEDGMVSIGNDETIENPRQYYSTTQFLRDNNEFLREDMLRNFINLWNEMQDNFQWYFQSVGGINSVMKINPLTGKRVPADGRLVITLLEGLDQRVTHMLNLYRKVAWDDTYQRWMLPDMMRFFKLKLYVTEFRTFHRPFTKGSDTTGGSYYETGFLTMLTDTMPTYIIEFDRCEIDIESINILPDMINIGEAEMRQVEMSIKVGNFKEEYINPMLNFFWDDMVLNSLDRSNIANLDSSIFLNDTKKSGSLRMLYEIGKAQETLMAEPQHKFGTPFLQMANSKTLFGAKGAGPDGQWGTNDDDTVVIDPTEPNTWLGNLFTIGKATVKNFVKDKVGQAKTMKIPGLGISFNEALGAIQSKNVFTLLAIGRKAIRDTVSGTMPSQELEENFVDTQYKIFLENVVESQATDDTLIDNKNITVLRNAANLALNDRGTWEKIRDLSKATDLVSRALNEINTPTSVQNSTSLRENYNAQIVETIPVQRGIIYEGIPSSSATNGALVANQVGVVMPPPGSEIGKNATDGLDTTDLGSTDGNLGKGSTIKSSILLGNNPGGPLPRGENQLGNNAGEKINDIKASLELGSNAGGQLARGTSMLGDRINERLPMVDPGAALKGNIEGGNIINSTYKPVMTWNKMDVPDPGEAVDGDPIDERGSFRRPPPSSSLDQKI